MSTPYIAQIAIFPYHFAPRNWSFCKGQQLAINQYQALFSLIGTTYGGDGRTSTGLPDFQGRIGIQQGTGMGLTPQPLGRRGGVETVTLSAAEMPMHIHNFTNEFGPNGDTVDISDAYLAHNQKYYEPTHEEAETLGGISSGQSDATGGSQSHENRMPYTVLNFCIALDGQYPSRS